MSKVGHLTEWLFSHYTSEVMLSLGCTTNRELEAQRGHWVRLLEPSNQTGERPSLFALYPKAYWWDSISCDE